MPNENKRKAFLSSLFSSISPIAKQIGGNYPGQAQQMLNQGSTPQDVIGSISGRRTGNINLPPMNPNAMPMSIQPSMAAPSPGMMQQISQMNPFSQFGKQIDSAKRRGNNNVR